jgi:hypothetical protein
MKNIIKLLVLLIAVLPLNSAMAVENITGAWQGKLVTSPGADMNIQFVIKQEAGNSYSAILNSPDEGGMKNIKASSVTFNSGNLKLDVAELSGSYEGVLKDGKIDGKGKQEGTSFPLSLSPYAKPTFSKKDMDTLLGSWNGKLTIPEVTVVFRFEMSDKGEFVGFSDWPDNGGYGAPFTDVEISDGNLSLKIPDVPAEFSGKFTDNEIAGKLKYDGVPIRLTLALKKGEYVAPAYKLSLPEDTMEQLSGKWNGKLPAWDKKSDPMNLIFKFEKSKSGDFFGFMDIPAQRAKNMPVTEANLSDGKLILKIKGALVVTFKGQLSGDKLVGEWATAGETGTILSLKKEMP